MNVFFHISHGFSKKSFFSRGVNRVWHTACFKSPSATFLYINSDFYKEIPPEYVCFSKPDSPVRLRVIPTNKLFEISLLDLYARQLASFKDFSIKPILWNYLPQYNYNFIGFNSQISWSIYLGTYKDARELSRFEQFPVFDLKSLIQYFTAIKSKSTFTDFSYEDFLLEAKIPLLAETNSVNIVNYLDSLFSFLNSKLLHATTFRS